MGPRRSAVILCLAFAAPAAAASGADTRPLQQILVLLAMVALAYLVAHLLLDRLSRRFGIVTGVEYLLLGALLGGGLGLLDPETFQGFHPAIVMGTGSLGLLTGLRLNLREFKRADWEALRISFVLSATTLVAVAGIPAAALHLALTFPEAARWMPALLCAGAVAMVANPEMLESLIGFLEARGPAADLSRRVARMCSSFAIAAFGFLFCFYNPAESGLAQQLAFWHWLGVHLLLGAVLGALFGIFLRKDFEDEKLLTVVVGMVILSSGLAYHLRLSPLFVNFILGVMLINTTQPAHHVESMLRSVERPFYIALFAFAGLVWTFDAPWWAYLLAVPYLWLRHLGRAAGGALGAWGSSLGPWVPGMGHALLSPGGLSVAMVLNYDEVFGHSEFGAVMYSALLVAIVLSEVMSYRRARSWLIDAADVSTTQSPTQGGLAPSSGAV
jgi:Kef-type K+ transport system membrane component KefB